MYRKLPVLNSLPEAEEDGWLDEYSKLMQDGWLRKKLSRERRLSEHLSYLMEYSPELFCREPPGLVLDLGPGCGELLEIARMLGFDVLGVDAAEGAGGMGDEYLQVCKLMAKRQDLPIRYCGLEKFLAEVHVDPSVHGTCVLINSRGSIEQMFHRLMNGPKHHLHQDAKRLRWQENGRTQEVLEAFLWRCKQLLAFGGILLIAANGAANTEFYDRCLCRAAAEVGGLRLVQHQRRIHKFCKESG